MSNGRHIYSIASESELEIVKDNDCIIQVFHKYNKTPFSIYIHADKDCYSITIDKSKATRFAPDIFSHIPPGDLPSLSESDDLEWFVVKLETK